MRRADAIASRDRIYARASSILFSNLTEDELLELFAVMNNDPYDGFFELISAEAHRRRPELLDESGTPEE